eukprot:8591722-Alexandrium_andersonii.AAC.1
MPRRTPPPPAASTGCAGCPTAAAFERASRAGQGRNASRGPLRHLHRCRGARAAGLRRAAAALHGLRPECSAAIPGLGP